MLDLQNERDAVAKLAAVGDTPNAADLHRGVMGLAAIARRALDEIERLRAPGEPLGLDVLGKKEPVDSRRYKPRYDFATRHPILVACASAGMTEEQTIEHLAAALDASQSQCARHVETPGSPRISIPFAPPQPGPSVEERLTRYRCAGLNGLMPRDLDEPTSAAIAERQAHAMLAAEKAVLT